MIERKIYFTGQTLRGIGGCVTHLYVPAMWQLMVAFGLCSTWKIFS